METSSNSGSLQKERNVSNTSNGTTALGLHDVLDEMFQNDGGVALTLDYRLNLAQRLYRSRNTYYVLSCLYCAVEVAIALECSMKSALRRDSLLPGEREKVKLNYDLLVSTGSQVVKFNSCIQNYNALCRIVACCPNDDVLRQFIISILHKSRKDCCGLVSAMGNACIIPSTALGQESNTFSMSKRSFVAGNQKEGASVVQRSGVIKFRKKEASPSLIHPNVGLSIERRSPSMAEQSVYEFRRRMNNALKFADTHGISNDNVVEHMQHCHLVQICIKNNEQDVI